MAVNYNPKIVTNGLVMHLDAANIKSYAGSGTTWFDLSGNQANMTLVNGPTFVSSNKGGILLDGVNDYIGGLKPSGFMSNGTFTYDVWFKFNSGDSIGNGAQLIVINSRGDGVARSNNGFNSVLYIDSVGKLRCYTFSGGGTTDYDTGLIVNVGEICNVGMIHNASLNKAGFKNGQLSLFQSSWSTQSFNNFLIGGEHNESGYYLQMSYPNITIYCVKVYNRALSQLELTQNFNALRGRYGI